jgi:hypothetical protein
MSRRNRGSITRVVLLRKRDRFASPLPAPLRIECNTSQDVSVVEEEANMDAALPQFLEEDGE